MVEEVQTVNVVTGVGVVTEEFKESGVGEDGGFVLLLLKVGQLRGTKRIIQFRWMYEASMRCFLTDTTK